MAKSTVWVVKASLEFLDASVNPMSDQAKSLFLLLEGFARNYCFCYPGNERLAKAAGKKERAMQNSCKELEQKGWIKRTFVRGEKLHRTGFILLRRADPAMPAAQTPEEFAEAEATLLEIMKDRSARKKLPASACKKLHHNKSPLCGDDVLRSAAPAPVADAGAASPAGREAVIGCVVPALRQLMNSGHNLDEAHEHIYTSKKWTQRLLKLAGKEEEDGELDNWIDEAVAVIEYVEATLGGAKATEPARWNAPPRNLPSSQAEPTQDQLAKVESPEPEKPESVNRESEKPKLPNYPLVYPHWILPLNKASAPGKQWVQVYKNGPVRRGPMWYTPSGETTRMQNTPDDPWPPEGEPIEEYEEDIPPRRPPAQRP